MANKVEGGSLWLPSEFLNDDELFTRLKADRCEVKGFNDFRHHGYVNSFGFGSDLSSPLESFLGSVETESDEEDLVAGLTRKLAYSSLGDSNFFAENAKGWKLSASPQSTLCSTATGCGCVNRPSHGPPVSSPAGGEDAAAWHLLLAAAEESARMRLMEETAAFRCGKPFAPSRKPDSVDRNQGSGLYPKQSPLSYQQLQAAQFQQLKQQQQASSVWEQEKLSHHQMVQSVKKNGGSGKQSLSMASCRSTQNSQTQRQPSSGMRAVFLGESDAKSKRAGTGVFLPRNLGATPVETRKRTGCPVLLPDRVVQALNLNVKSMDVQLPQSLPKRNDHVEANAAMKHRNAVLDEQRRNLRMVRATMNEELKLPQEWTY